MPFHIHMPKPLHGWKAFFNEITVIVIGVLIALGLEAGVETLHWRHKAKDGEERLKIELTAIGTNAAEHIVTAPCVQTQLERLRARLLASKEVMDPLAFVQDGYNTSTIKMPRRAWSTQTWEALQQDGTTNHLPNREQRLLGLVYGKASAFRAEAGKTDDRRGRLSIAGLPIQLSPEIKADLLRDISSQMDQTQSAIVNASQLIAALRMAGFAPSDAEINDMLYRSNGQALNTTPYCQAMHLPLADWRAEVAKVNLAVF